MGANVKNFQIGSSSGPMGTIVLIILGIIAIYILYKVFLYYQDRKRWEWFMSLCKEKRLSAKETTYLRQLVMRKKIKSTDDLLGSIYSLNLPTPIKKKLLF